MDNEQFWKLLESIHAEAAGFAQKLTGNRAEGEDLYHDAVLQARRTAGSLRNVDSFRPWFYQILVNRYRNSCRHWWFSRRSDTGVVEAHSDPRDGFEVRSRLNKLLAVLSPRDRALVILHEIEDWPISKLAELARRPEATVRIWLYRARLKMRRHLMQVLSEELGNQKECEGVYALLGSEKITD